ncbi:MAG TPA: neocarzinostatin apoprotein domain-containing protein, partial [Acidimicrobiales bacterium]|nr:neocarzinostatin apoprotein domain-containing protein [Acidimicrobiales bacterium]
MHLGRVTCAAFVGLPLLVGVLGGCGGSTGTVVRPPASTAPALVTTTTTTTVASPTTRPPAGAQQISVSPAAGLTSGEKVTVTGSGFSANEALVVTQCAAKATAT